MAGVSRRQRGAVAALVLGGTLASPASTIPGLAQGAWPFHLAWDHNGPPAQYYRLCVNGGCSTLDAVRTQGTAWRAPLPLMPPGEYRLVVEACGRDQCVPGTPDLMIRVLPPSSRRPPIDVVNGPRIPVPRR